MFELTREIFDATVGAAVKCEFMLRQVRSRNQRARPLETLLLIHLSAPLLNVQERWAGRVAWPLLPRGPQLKQPARVFCMSAVGSADFPWAADPAAEEPGRLRPAAVAIDETVILLTLSLHHY